MKLKGKVYLNIFIIGILSLFAVYLFVEYKLSKDSLELLSVWINTMLFTILIIVIFIVFIIISFIRILL